MGINSLVLLWERASVARTAQVGISFAVARSFLQLVNCISNDCQFWHDKTDFMLRPVYDRRAKRYLSLGETYRQPLQALLIDTALLARHGLEIHANRPDDITEAVRYTLDCLDGIWRPLREGGELLDRYRAALASNPCSFGAALPVPHFLESFPELLE
jgi:putative glycosyltransferase (TIGR04372 family)